MTETQFAVGRAQDAPDMGIPERLCCHSRVRRESAFADMTNGVIPA